MRHSAPFLAWLLSVLSVGSAWPKGKVLSDIYGHLHFKLMRATARALLARSPPILTDGQWLNACCVSSIVMYHVCIYRCKEYKYYYYCYYFGGETTCMNY